MRAIGSIYRVFTKKAAKEEEEEWGGNAADRYESVHGLSVHGLSVHGPGQNASVHGHGAGAGGSGIGHLADHGWGWDQAASNHACVASHEAAQSLTATQNGDVPPGTDEAAGWEGVSQLIRRVRDSVIGGTLVIQTPFGPRRLLDADPHGEQSLEFIERYILEEVLPLQAFAFTNKSPMGLKVDRLVEDAREMVLKAVKGNANDAVLFVHDTRVAMQKLMDAWHIRLPPYVNQQDCVTELGADSRPVVLISVTEPAEKESIWRESTAEVVRVPVNEQGTTDLAALEVLCTLYKRRPVRIGAFSASAPDSDVLNPIENICIILARFNFLSVWDYSSSGAFMDVHVQDKEAVILAPRTFPGGPGAATILVAKRKIFRGGDGSQSLYADQASDRATPTGFNSGVTAMHLAQPSPIGIETRYIEQYGGGRAPGAIECVRAGLVVKLKESVGADLIEHCQASLLRRLISRWQHHPNINILGPADAKRVSSVALQIYNSNPHWDGKLAPIGKRGRAPRGQMAPKLLHHKFVGQLLFDLFGVVAGVETGGVPPSQGDPDADAFSEGQGIPLMKQNVDVLRSGWVTIHVRYFASDQHAAFLIECVQWVATHGWKMVPYYTLDHSTGDWQHYSVAQGAESAYAAEVASRLSSAGYHIKQRARQHAKTALRDLPAISLKNVLFEKSGTVLYPSVQYRLNKSPYFHYLQAADSVITDSENKGGSNAPPCAPPEVQLLGVESLDHVPFLLPHQAKEMLSECLPVGAAPLAAPPSLLKRATSARAKVHFGGGDTSPSPKSPEGSGVDVSTRRRLSNPEIKQGTNPLSILHRANTEIPDAAAPPTVNLAPLSEMKPRAPESQVPDSEDPVDGQDPAAARLQARRPPSVLVT